jgi:hypothetical protein
MHTLGPSGVFFANVCTTFLLDPLLTRLFCFVFFKDETDVLAAVFGEAPTLNIFFYLVYTNLSFSLSFSLSARYYRILNNRHKKVLLLLMCARACVCVPYRELSLSVCLSLSLRGDDEETKTRVLYLIEKVFIR